MNFIIALLMAVLPALSLAQSQPEAGQSLPSGAIPKTIAVLVIQTPKQGVTVQQVMAMIPDEIQATVRLYLDGKIREWYSRGDGKGVILLVDAADRGRGAGPDGNAAACESTFDGSRVHSRRSADAAKSAEPNCIPVTPRNGATVGETSFRRRLPWSSPESS
jgi:hypothetical protein